MSSPPAPRHAATPAGEASESEKELQEQGRCPGGTWVRSARPCPSASSGRVIRSQARTHSARTLAAKKPVLSATKRASDVIDSAPPQHRKEKHLAAPLHRALNEAHCSHPPPSPLTVNSGDATASPARTWESAVARGPNTPTLTPTLQKTG